MPGKSREKRDRVTKRAETEMMAVFETLNSAEPEVRIILCTFLVFKPIYIPHLL